MATGERGLHELSIQEATNATAQRKVVRVSPTLQAAALDANDVMFNGTEIPNATLKPGGCSKLVRLEIVNYSDTSCDMDLVFTENTVTLGTVDAAVTIEVADLKTAKVLGTIRFDASVQEIDLANMVASGEGRDKVTGGQGIMLQAAKDSTSVYFAGVDRTGADVDDLEFIFHIEY